MMKEHTCISAVLCCGFFTGCAYLHDRGRDACDMVTVSVEETGVNASIQFLTASTGLGTARGKGVGLRSGALGIYEFSEINLGLTGEKTLNPNERDQDREKGYKETYVFFPWWDKHGGVEMELEEGGKITEANIECAVCVGLGVRAGINLAEILDFILGWTTLDILGDDIATIEKREMEASRRRREVEATSQAENPTQVPLPKKTENHSPGD